MGCVVCVVCGSGVWMVWVVGEAWYGGVWSWGVEISWMSGG